MEHSNGHKTALFFKGRFDTLPEIGEIGDVIGDVIIVDRGEYVWSGRWEKLGKTESENAEEQATETKKEQNKVLKPKICKQCGAPLKGLKCEYCGTEYKNIFDKTEIDQWVDTDGVLHRKPILKTR